MWRLYIFEVMKTEHKTILQDLDPCKVPASFSGGLIHFSEHQLPAEKNKKTCKDMSDPESRRCEVFTSWR